MSDNFAKFNETLECLAHLQNKNPRMFIGIDGFVDEIIHVVRRRYSATSFDRIDTISEYAERIAKAAGLSTNIEYVPMHVKLGGNGPIMANALLEYGVDIIYAGALGKPDIHPVFKSLAEKSTVYSLSDPGHTDAVEFFDGKLIIGKHHAIREINWERFKNELGGVQQIAQLISSCDLFGMENWVMIAYMSEIWDGIIQEVFPLLSDCEVKPLAFFDLCDPEKRSAEDILYALKQISQFEEKFRTILGLNEKEALEIASVLELKTDYTLEPQQQLRELAEKIRQKLKIYCLVLHPTKYAVACTAEDTFQVSGPYCEKPVLTTGAGDNFNAGFCYAMALGLPIEDALVVGVSTSGFYVRNGKSPIRQELAAFIQAWRDGTLEK